MPLCFYSSGLKTISTGKDRCLFSQVRNAAIIIILALTFHQIYLACIHPFKIGWDTALHLQCAQLITRGMVPYVDLFDVNPPLIWYIDTIPAFAASIFSQPATLTFSFFLTGIIFYSASMSLYLLLKSDSDKELRFIIPFVLGLIMFNFFLRYDFGQREDIFVLLYMPFFILRWLRWNYKPVETRSINIIVGILGGVGICLKPHFLIPCALVELFWLIEKRAPGNLIKTETIAAFSFGVLYLIHFLFVPSEMRENYFGFLLPAFMLGYHFWDASTAAMFCPPDKRNVFFLMVLAICFAVALRKRSTLFLPLCVFAISSNIPYLIQFKGWAYHNQPVYAASTILGYMIAGYFVFLAGRYIKESCNLPNALVLYAVPALIASAAVYDAYTDTKKVAEEPKFAMETVGFTGTSPRADLDSPFLGYFEKYYRKGDTVVFMSNGVTPGYPTLTQLDCAPGSRHLHCVILSVLHYITEIKPQTPKTKALAEKMQMVVEQYGDDILKRKPKLVFEQVGPVADYLKSYDFESKYLSEYKKVDEIANFRVFVRQGQ